MGTAASLGQFLLISGTPGKRSTLPHASMPRAGIAAPRQTSAADIVIQARRFERLQRWIAALTAAHRIDRGTDSAGLGTRQFGSPRTRRWRTASSIGLSTGRVSWYPDEPGSVPVLLPPHHRPPRWAACRPGSAGST
ncbi:ClpP family protease [Pseudonocardia sp. Cha107L01]|uniref:ClpP family protease n=1 Tax=Pseudonocardia sp. Cha107L01 TaxID=3457576 RepID=UPI00403E455B